MIVNYTEQGWEIITQRAHGLLAAQVAMHWSVAERPQRWTETLLAIAEHDDAQTELQSDDLLTPQGGPVNFSMKLFEPEHCQRLADFALSKSRYIALLTSMHMVFLYKKEGNTNPLVKPFLQEQQRLQKQWCKELKIGKPEAERVYHLLEWCDAFSLLLCQHEVQPEQRTIEVSQGPSQKHYQLQQTSTGNLTVQPWPFEEDTFELHIEKRLIKQLQFKSNEEFKQLFLEAEVQEKTWQLAKK
ncbi:DUF3891 family protein [Mucilaginibacter robiniae]|uniref:DUF3891 family protein n=1 Tax=Mucilaginibacter robiniae TaxID=2728022 RepID=A0A7L5DYA5_9SPHI|nr:DUF3891 family protein [Mucilaginibacter robiniae]QJD95188.1 DUF3891 family protein [Mucilaginibacter robiniae]